MTHIITIDCLKFGAEENSSRWAGVQINLGQIFEDLLSRYHRIQVNQAIPFVKVHYTALVKLNIQSCVKTHVPTSTCADGLTITDSGCTTLTCKYRDSLSRTRISLS